MSRETLLLRAREILVGTFAGRHLYKETAALADLIALELNEPLDWEKIDEAYEMIVGGEESYVPTVVSHLLELRGLPTSTGKDHVSEVLMTNFTHTSPLRAMGKLFLRRVELGVSNAPLRDGGRAYGCFNACRLLETSKLEKETATTGFEIARTIITSARMSHSVNPFRAHPEEEGFVDLLSLAEAKLDSARARSVGSFYTTVCAWQKDLQALRREVSMKS